MDVWLVVVLSMLAGAGLAGIALLVIAMRSAQAANESKRQAGQRFVDAFTQGISQAATARGARQREPTPIKRGRDDEQGH